VLPERSRLPQLAPEPAQQAHRRLVGHAWDVRWCAGAVEPC
jgi:hypothetical protein